MPENEQIPEDFLPNSISSMRSNIINRGGVQHGSRYIVEFITPFGSFVTYPSEVNIPQRALSTYSAGTPTSLNGTVRKVPIQNEYDEITMSFVIYQDWAEKNFFDKWMDFIVNKGNYPDQYQEVVRLYSQMVGKIYISTITAQSQVDDPTFTSRTLLDEAYPLSILPVSLSADNTGYTTLVMTFAFRKTYNLGVGD